MSWKMIFTDSIKKRLYAKIKRGQPDECWEWQGYVHPSGYGNLRIDNYAVARPHRLIAALELGLDYENKKSFVCHKCDNTRCCNPNHLVVANGLYNAQDREKKKRGRQPKGTAQASTKLVERDIQTIFDLHNKGMTTQGIGKKYGVSVALVCYVLKRQNWGHVKLRAGTKYVPHIRGKDLKKRKKRIYETKRD